GGYHLFGFEDDDLPGNCSPPKKIFTAPLRPPGDNAMHKLWGTSAVDSERICVATVVGDESDPCNLDPARPGVAECWSQTPDVAGAAVSMFIPKALAAGGGNLLIDD